MKLVSWQTNLAGCEIEVKSGQIQQVWIVFPQNCKCKLKYWTADTQIQTSAQWKYWTPSTAQIQAAAATMSFATNSLLDFHTSSFPSLCVERIVCVLSTEGCLYFNCISTEGVSVFQILPVEMLCLKYEWSYTRTPYLLDKLIIVLSRKRYQLNKVIQLFIFFTFGTTFASIYCTGN